jgi:CHAT domain-containing protein/tetratricopeptide (TPR) repeat protein
LRTFLSNTYFGCFFLLISISCPSIVGAYSPSSSPNELNSLILKASSLRAEGSFNEAIEVNTRILSLLKQAPNKDIELKSYKELGFLYWNIGKLPDSQAAFKKALVFANALGDRLDSSYLSTSLKIHELYQSGKKLRVEGDYTAALDCFNRAIKYSNDMHSNDHLVKCQRLKSLIYWDIGNFTEFYNLNESSLRLAHQTRNKREESNCLNNIGVYFIKAEDYSQAIKYCERAYTISHETQNLQGESDSLSNLGIIYQELGDYDKALDHINKSLIIDSLLNDISQISTDYINKGTILRKRGLLRNSQEDLDSALRSFSSCLPLTRRAADTRLEIALLNNIGTVYSDKGQYSKAMDYFNRAYELSDKIEDNEKKSRVLNNLGIICYKMGNYDRSSQFLERSISLALENHDSQILWEVLLERGNTYTRQARYHEALTSYKNSISLIENVRSSISLEELKARYLGTDKRIEAYQNLIALLVKLHRMNPAIGYDREAFNYLERAKARAFLDSLEISKIDISEGINPIQANREKELMRDLSRAYNKLLTSGLSQSAKEGILSQIKTYEDELEALKRDIRMSSPAYADLKYPEVINYEEVLKDLMARDLSFFAYSVGKEASYAFVISSHGLRIFDLPSKDALQRQVIEYRKAISDLRNLDFHLGTALFQELIGPGLGHGVKKIIIVPDDILNLLPFETLLTNAEPKSWLIRDYMVGYVPSLSSLRVLKQRYHAERRPNKDLLAIGDVLFRSNGGGTADGSSSTSLVDLGTAENIPITQLKYSALEVQNISHLFARDKVTVLEKEDASERWLKSHPLTDYRIIHFATHSLVDDKKPARSAILLSYNPTQGEDGLLQAREIYNLKLSADLVTLSACQTGLGQFIRGEGIEGLNRAFFYAGTSSILMSLWAVNDQATFHLMERFYRHLQRGESLAGSLREAKLEMIHSNVFSHPYYWAGFVINGKTDSRIYSGILNLGILAVLFGIGMAAALTIAVHKKHKIK